MANVINYPNWPVSLPMLFLLLIFLFIPLVTDFHSESEPANKTSGDIAIKPDSTHSIQQNLKTTEVALRENVSGDWWSNVQKSIAESEYEINWQEERNCYSSPNRAQNLRFDYYDNGFLVSPRTEKTWTVKMTLTSFGKGEMIPFVPGTLAAEKNKAHSKAEHVTVTYENTKEGMRQDFIIHERPSGDDYLQLEIDVDSRLAFSVQADKRGIGFSDIDGQLRYRYVGLKVTDANGKELVAEMQKRGDGLSILINDMDGFYPILIDPLSTSANWSAESNQVSAFFGISVASAGDVNGDGYSDVILGANLYDNGQTDEGRAFVYHGSAGGLSLTSNWTAESDQLDAHFGYSVASAGDVNGDGYSDVIIGAYIYDNGQTNEGRAFVYHGSFSGLSLTFNWTAESDQAGANFGRSVSSAGDVNGDGYSDIIVGAYLYDNGHSNEGRAFVYHGSSGGLSLTSDWTAEGDQADAWFGWSAASGGDVNGDGYSDIIIGAYRFDNGQTDEGRAFVYHGSSGGLSLASNWTMESDQPGANFGLSVASAGDVNGDGYSDIIVGAERYDNGEIDEGRAFVYHGSSGGLSLTPDWTAEGDQEGAHLGFCVASAGDVNGDGYSDIIIGAYRFDNGQTDEGRALVYHGSSGGLSLASNWSVESDQASANFGFSVASAGDVNGDGYSDVIAGAYRYDNGQTDEGSVFVYHGSSSSLSLTSNWTAESDQLDAHFGYSVASAGDVNGDGYSDVIIGAYIYDNGQTNEGRAFVYHGSSSGLSLTFNWTAESDQAGANFGRSVSSAGDVNGDGYSDIIVGAYLYDNGQSNEGRAFVYHGSSGGLSLTSDWMAESDQADAFFGLTVASAGDVNGDGYSDVIVGADQYDNNESDEGRVFVYHGSFNGLTLTFNWTAESDQVGAHFGFTAASGGDVNGDGYSDVIVGAPFYDNGQSNEGVALAYHGSSTGLSLTSNWMAENDQANAWFGRSVASAGDVNGDGYSDVIVGAGYYDNGQTDEGLALMYYGSSTGLSLTYNWTAESDQAGAEFGNCVASAGDVNGDGYSDVIIGAFRFDNGQTDEGRVFVYYGSSEGLSLISNWTVESDQAGAGFGNRVASGDVNGDGYSDVIVGAYRYDNGQSDEGRVFVYYGNNGGIPVTPRLFRSDQTTPIAPLGRTHSTSDGWASIKCTGFMGRGDVKGVFETKQLGMPFDGTNTTESEWTDPGTTGVNISQALSALSSGDRYKLRMRLKYSQVLSVQPYGRWVYLPGNGGLGETDFLVSNVADNEPTIQSSNLTFPYPPDPNALTLQWTSGNGTSRIVVARESEAVTAFPIDGKTYSGAPFGAGSELSDGQFVVYNGSENVAAISGLAATTTYHFRIFEYNGSSNLENYDASDAPGNPNSIVTLASAPTTQSSGIVFSNVTVSSMTLSWDAGDGTERLVIGREATAVSSTPVDGTSYMGNSDFSAAPEIHPGERILYRGMGNSLTVTGLSSNTIYHFRVFEFNGTDAQINYNTSTGTGNPASRSTLKAEPSAQATELSFSAITENSISVSFVAATDSPDGYLVLMKAESSPADAPVDGMGYTEGNTIGVSTVVYAGNSTSFTVSGLNSGTVYYFDIFSYNGTTDTYNYLITSPLEASRSTHASQPQSQPSAVNFSSITVNSMNVSFTSATGSPDGYLALMKSGSSPDDVPVDGTGYAAESTIGTSTVAYTGNSTSFNVSGLMAGTVYYFDIFSYNGTTDTYNYLTTSPLEANRSTHVSEPASQPTGLNFSSITANSLNVSFNAAAGSPTGYIGLRRPDAAPTDLPVDGVEYTIGQLAGSSTVAYSGSEVTFNNSGLSAGTNYHYAIYSFNGTTDTYNYLTTSPLTGNQQTLPASEFKINPPGYDVKFSDGGNVSVEVTGASGPLTVTLQARKITDTDFTPYATSLKTGTTTFFDAAVTSAMADELGTEFYFEASDGVSAIRNPSNYFLYKSINASSNQFIPFASGFNGKTSTYQMFSVPYELADKDIDNLFDVALNGHDNTQWRLFHFQNNSYKEYPTQFRQVKLGDAYWFNTIVRDFQIKLGDGTVAKAHQNAPFTKTLEAGWNQIGNPYPFNIDWNVVAGGNDKIGPLWFFNNGSYAKSNVFKPWTGAFVHADEAMTLAIPVLAKTTASGRTSNHEMEADLDAEQWLLPITLRINDLQQVSGVGMHPQAKTSKDKFDEITIPRFLDYAEMNTYHEEFFSPRFSTDVVPTSEEQAWIFDVKSNLEDEQGELSWDHRVIATNKSSLILIDLFDGKWVDMKTTGAYSFTHRKSRQFKVLYNREGEIKPGVTLLGEAYPNPFTTELTIPVLIDQPGYRQIGIYDVLGRLIRTLMKDFSQTGLHEIHWDAKDDGGNQVNKGLLFYQIEDKNKRHVKRIIKI